MRKKLPGSKIEKICYRISKRGRPAQPKEQRPSRSVSHDASPLYAAAPISRSSECIIEGTLKK